MEVDTVGRAPIQRCGMPGIRGVMNAARFAYGLRCTRVPTYVSVRFELRLVCACSASSTRGADVKYIVRSRLDVRVFEIPPLPNEERPNRAPVRLCEFWMFCDRFAGQHLHSLARPIHMRDGRTGAHGDRPESSLPE